MAIIKDYLNTNNMNTLADWMTQHLVPTYFGSVVAASSTTLNCYDSDDNTVLNINIGANQYSDIITAYASETVSTSLSNGEGISKITYAATCSRGCLLTFSSGSNGRMEVLITKSNNNITTVVFSKGITTNNGQLYGMYCVAWGDINPISSLSVTPITTAQQTQIVPFLSNAPYGTISYTPDAFYIPVGQYYGMGIGQLTLNGNIYLTNGYWAIKDGAVSTS